MRIMTDHERVEVPSDDVAMGASDPAIGGTLDARQGRTLWDCGPLAHVLFPDGSERGRAV